MEARDREYENLLSALGGLIGGEEDALANLSNCAALLFLRLADVNWAGFYILRGDELVLGPFQGKPACVRIAIGRGVCGAAAARRETIVVEDVHQFPGHIACDGASESEIVVPILKEGRLLGVLDIDSPVRARFGEADRRGLEHCVAMLCERIRLEDWIA
ncbi:MAG: GAF domain-containing protein [Clostridiales bacterium]|jgi:L-methionine (R)-S-oxide reductase|nr:GAF domain-containing protein [Clostridiales bacterium]